MSTATLDHAQVDQIMGDLKIVDGDSHFAEPADLWTSRAPASMRDQMPQIKKIEGGSTVSDYGWFIGEDFWTGLGGHTIATGLKKTKGVLCLPYADIDEAAFTVEGRVRIMDEQGVYASVLYPNAMGFASNMMLAIPDVEFRTLLLRLYNDALVDYQNESGGRLLGQAVLPTWDMDLTVAEMNRMLGAGITGFTITDKPHLLGQPDLDDEYFAPMWSLANEAGIAMNFHIGSGAPPTIGKTSPMAGKNSDVFWESFGPQRRMAILATQFYMSNVRIITNMIMSDMFDRYPNVKIVSAESGAGWVPFMLEAAEYQLDEMVTDPSERSLQQKRPKEYFRSNIFVMSWFEKSFVKVLDDIGVDNVMLMTDIPHPTCLYPDTRAYFAEVTKDLAPDVRRKLVQDTAARVYGVTVPAS